MPRSFTGMTQQERVQILCATMHQSDLSKVGQMHITGCDAVLANQADSFGYCEKNVDGFTVQMITTATRGVGKNRNLALAFSSGDILLFADDDLTYEADAIETVARAFRSLPDAEMIVFGIRYVRDGAEFRTRVPKTGRLPFLKALRYGTCAIAVRRDSLLRYNLHFTELFGGGCLYSYGEDTDFIVQCYRSRMRVCGWGEVIATTCKDSSTCFTGYGEKYYFDKGALARNSLGIMALPYALRMVSKRLGSSLSLAQRLRWFLRGYRCFPKLISYEDFLLP